MIVMPALSSAQASYPQASRADQPQRLTRWLRYIPLVGVSTTIIRRWRQLRVGQLAIIFGTEAETLPFARCFAPLAGGASR